MKQILLLIMATTFLLRGYSQKSAEDDGGFEFETQDDGNKKFIKYTAINFGYSLVDYEVDQYSKFSATQAQAYTFSWEGYNTYTKKVAGSTQVRAAYFDNQDFLIALDYGLYFVLFKGLYLKIQGGYGTLFSNETDVSPNIWTYGGEGGYLFKLKTGEGRRPLYVSLYGGYHGFSGTGLDYNTAYINTYSGAGPGGGLKLMWGSKPSN